MEAYFLYLFTYLLNVNVAIDTAIFGQYHIGIVSKSKIPNRSTTSFQTCRGRN